ncbi:hypothetical protein VTN96DRAFT_1602 [Rasamsonia emersonii]
MDATGLQREVEDRSSVSKNGDEEAGQNPDPVGAITHRTTRKTLVARGSPESFSDRAGAVAIGGTRSTLLRWCGPVVSSHAKDMLEALERSGTAGVTRGAVAARPRPPAAPERQARHALRSGSGFHFPRVDQPRAGRRHPSRRSDKESYRVAAHLARSAYPACLLPPLPPAEFAVLCWWSPRLSPIRARVFWCSPLLASVLATGVLFSSSALRAPSI